MTDTSSPLPPVTAERAVPPDDEDARLAQFG